MLFCATTIIITTITTTCRPASGKNQEYKDKLPRMEMLTQIIIWGLYILVLYTKFQSTIYKMGNKVTTLLIAHDTAYIHILAINMLRLKMVLIVLVFCFFH